MRRYLAIVTLSLLLVACGRPVAMPTPTPTLGSVAPTAEELALGARVMIGERALFIQCANLDAPGPSVILEAGLAADHNAWAAVQPIIAEEARVCSYDRAGLGQSDAGPLPRDAARVAADLKALLVAAQIRGPYLLVAHSFGGLFARRFAADNPELVAGMVLVDAVHEDWWSRALAALPPATAGESARLANLRAYLTDGFADPACNGEHIDIPTTATQAREAGTLGALPLVVLVAGVPDAIAPGLPSTVEAKLVQLLQDDLPTALAALSRDSTRVLVPDSGHNIPGQSPAMVLLAVQAVLAATAP